MAAIKEHERVILTKTIPDERLESGDVGTVVHVYRDGLAYAVEFTTLDGRTAAVVTVEASDVRPVSRSEITHARLAYGTGVFRRNNRECTAAPRRAFPAALCDE